MLRKTVVKWSTFQQSIKDSLNSFRSHRLRTALTSLGVIFGVAAVISMLAIAEGAKQDALQSIELMGLNNIYIVEKLLSDQETKEAKKKNPEGLNLEDCQAIQEVVPQTIGVVPVIAKQTTVRTQAATLNGSVLGVTPDYFLAVNQRISTGRILHSLDEQDVQRVAVLGAEAARILFPGEPAVGKLIRMNGNPFRVVGVLQRIGRIQKIPGMIQRELDKEIYIPFSSMSQRIRGGMDRDRVQAIVVRMNKEANIQSAGDLIQSLLQRRHRDANDFNVIIPEELLIQSQRTQRTFTIVMGAIAGISLLVGGIGIMNIMLSSVLERTREIGIRRAVGATKKEITKQFLTEATLLSGVGGIIGLVLGILLALSITWIAGWVTIITLWSIFVAMIVSVGVGIGFGYYPAKQAAQLDPIDALRYE
ncbi:MAG: ABC transporter permease [bacterium]|nr:ABC transporter permease [bacterium]